MKPFAPPPSALRALLAALLIAFAIPTGLAAAGEKADYAIGVDGLACPFCAYGIEKQLTAIAGVETAETDIKSGAVTETMQPGSTLDEDAARKAVEAAGFTMRGFQGQGAGE